MLVRISVVLMAMGSSFTGSAQSMAPRDTVVSYLDVDGKSIATVTGAAYRVKSVATDSTAGVKLTYSLDGWLTERQEYSNLRNIVADGLHEQYFPQSHQLKVVSHFKQGKMEGELFSYYPSGKLKRRETYHDYVSMGGECFDEAGATAPFVPYYVLPMYPGGMQELSSFLGRNIIYPRKALRANQESKVLVSFVVDEKGGVTNAHVPVPRYALLDSEALRVVNRLPKWQPGRVEGEVKKVSFTLPVSFKIQ